MLDMTWRQQWRHLLSKQTYKLSSSEMSKIKKKVQMKLRKFTQTTKNTLPGKSFEGPER